MNKADKELFEAVKNDDLQRVQAAIAAGANVNAQDEYRRTPLHRAAVRGHSAIALLLIQEGAEINARDIAERMPLHFAASNGHTNAVRLLVDNGANVNAPDEFRQTPLDHALAAKADKTVELLKDAARSAVTDTDHPNKRNDQLLFEAIKNNRIPDARAAIETGANVNARDSWRNTPLHFAARIGNIDVIRLLIDNGADANAVNTSQETPLHCVRPGNRGDVTNLLEDAARKQASHADRVKQGRGDDEQQQTRQGRNPRYGNTEDHMSPKEATQKLFQAAEAGKVNAVQEALAAGADPTAKGDHQHTPLHFAAFNGQADIVRLLIERGADVNAEDSRQRTPLHIAAGIGQTSLTQLLIENGADVSAKDDMQKAPLDYAVAAKAEATADLLKDAIRDSAKYAGRVKQARNDDQERTR